MHVYRKIRLNCRPEEVWRLIQQASLFQDISKPLLTITTKEPLPEIWREGDACELQGRLFGLFPLAVRQLRVMKVDHDRRVLKTVETDSVTKRWRHAVRIQETSSGMSLYSDSIKINAGLFTPLIWAFTHLLYAYRQRKLRQMIAKASYR